MLRPKDLGAPLPLGALLLVCIALGLGLGAVWIAPGDVLASLAGRGDALSNAIILELRLPRVLQAALVGALLAGSGALSQGLFRNPLADPSLIGVTGGASLGAAVVLATGIASAANPQLSLALGAFLGGLAATALVYRIARAHDGVAMATLLLAGVAITALCGALVSLLELTVPDHLLRRMGLWRLGSVGSADRASVLLCGATLIAFVVALRPLPAFLNALLLGEAEASHLGFSVTPYKRYVTVVIAAVMAVCVSLVGAVAFVGLVVPHMVRLYAGPEHHRLLPRTLLLGAVVLVAADLLARTAIAPTEIPLGVVTALIGVPYFLVLLRRYQQRVVAS